MRATILAGSHENAVGKTFNVGSGVPVSIETLANLLVDLIVGKDVVIPFEYRPKSPGDFAQSYADISSIQKEIGFRPSFTIELGLRNYVEYLRNVTSSALEVPLAS